MSHLESFVLGNEEETLAAQRNPPPPPPLDHFVNRRDTHFQHPVIRPALAGVKGDTGPRDKDGNTALHL